MKTRNLIVKILIEDITFNESIQIHKLIVIGEDFTPFEISSGGIEIRRVDLSTSHEEADNIFFQQVMISSRIMKKVQLLRYPTTLMFLFSCFFTITLDT